ncbi:MAG: HAD hydrolase-like protein [Anaerolineae bacterium]|jgi:beta-phosphoglucomutase-like phosphatase (HAD superfamily)
MNKVLDEKQLATKSRLSELLVTIDDLKLGLAAGTSSHRSSAGRKLSAAGLSGVFRIVACGDGLAKGKPAPDIFLETATRLDFAPP